jgi:hypothetical protein
MSADVTDDDRWPQGSVACWRAMSAGSGEATRPGDEAAQTGRLDQAEERYAEADVAGDGAASAKLGVLREHRGPTFAGRTQVPKGETFSRSPTTGPLPGSVPGNN